MNELKANIREAVRYTLQCMMVDFTNHLQEYFMRKMDIYCIIFKELIVCIKLNIYDLCYMLMCQIILFPQ
jgi:hypothetical protein